MWDVLVIGGGATGLGTAVDAAARGYRTALLEQGDFAKGTSSRSTKLIHGGFRYLRQGNVSLVRESLRERGLLLRNAPHLVHAIPFVLPAYGVWQKFFYGAGLKIYDLLAGRLGLGKTRLLSREETLRHLPTLSPDGLTGGVQYFDGQFDDARLAICLAQTLHDLGGVAVNYCPVATLLKSNGRVCGVVARDTESGRELTIRARVVINATGVFTDAIRRLDEPAAKPIITASQGAHIVLDRSFLPGDSALMVPKTDDGRVLFAIPWHGHVVIGTTDTLREDAPLEPRPLAEEIDFLLEHAARYLTRAPGKADILSAFAGLRPLLGKAALGADFAHLPRTRAARLALRSRHDRRRQVDHLPRDGGADRGSRRDRRRLAASPVAHTRPPSARRQRRRCHRTAAEMLRRRCGEAGRTAPFIAGIFPAIASAPSESRRRSGLGRAPRNGAHRRGRAGETIARAFPRCPRRARNGPGSRRAAGEGTGNGRSVAGGATAHLPRTRPALPAGRARRLNRKPSARNWGAG